MDCITYYHDSDTSSTSHTYCALWIREWDYVELRFYINDINNELFVDIPSDDNQVMLDDSSIDNAITKAFNLWLKRYYQEEPAIQ